MKRTRMTALVASATALVVLLAGACTTPPAGAGPVGSWTVTTYMNAGDGLSSPVPGSTITLVVNADGSLGGRACNSYFGSWSADGSNITISDIGSTKMFCVTPEGVMQQESDYFSALSAARTWKVEGTTLTLAHPRGTSVIAERQR
jgi:heat shock protein HslJ